MTRPVFRHQQYIIRFEKEKIMKMKPTTRSATFTRKVVNPDEDVQFILVSKGTQTEPDFVHEMLADYKNSYNQQATIAQELEDKYAKSKERFSDLKDKYEELHFRYKHNPIIYRDMYQAVALERDALEKKLRLIKDILLD